MIESGGGTRFAEQLFQRVGLGGRSDELERDLAIEHHIIREADLAHASAADDLDDPIAGPARGAEGH